MVTCLGFRVLCDCAVRLLFTVIAFGVAVCLSGLYLQWLISCLLVFVNVSMVVNSVVVLRCITVG